jgi:hypothetical protein
VIARELYLVQSCLGVRGFSSLQLPDTSPFLPGLPHSRAVVEGLAMELCLEEYKSSIRGIEDICTSIHWSCACRAWDFYRHTENDMQAWVRAGGLAGDGPPNISSLNPPCCPSIKVLCSYRLSKYLHLDHRQTSARIVLIMSNF